MTGYGLLNDCLLTPQKTEPYVSQTQVVEAGVDVQQLP